MMVDLLVKDSEFTNSDGEKVVCKNFSLKCGEVIVPIQIKSFKDSRGIDVQYSTRRGTLLNYATIIPGKKEESK